MEPETPNIGYSDPLGSLCSGDFMVLPLYTIDHQAGGSKYPMFKDSGSKNHTLNGFWDQGL